ncbi:MAG TPA: Fe-S cluster assembly ATPase SufC [Vitreimonas sp.]|nr:Fe-S cluster assembly ATPase SufC [Vitreimonas sp.]
MSTSTLRVRNLRASIEDTEILKGIDLSVKPGEIHAVMGPNGSGKSTLAYTLAGHPSYEIAEGSEVSLDGEDVLEMSPDERANAGLFLAFQYPIEIPGVKVQNFLRMAYEARFVDQEDKKFPSVLKFREHVEKLADELEVNKELLKRGLNEGFSGGEKKRLEILQMAVLEPKYAILDETDSGLDIDAIKAVAHGVKKIVSKYNTGIVVITHYQRILEYLKPDFVHVLVKGKIAQSGSGELVDKLEKQGYKEWVE